MTDDSVQLDAHTLHVQTLFVQHQQAVLAYILSLEPDVHDAQEIVQETFVTASRKAATWTSGTGFFPWACAIARFNTLHFQRTRGRRKARLADDVVELLAEQAEDDFAQFQLRVNALQKCLQELAPRARELINLRYHAGKLPTEVASEIGWTVNSVRVALTRARHSLRDCLERSERAEAT
jgi:RNA polymerase sigma-70 factor (ECF subfamily)